MRNVNGSGNIAIGSSAGNHLSNHHVQSHPTNSIFIGNNSRGGAADQASNQIVIGANASGWGSNTAHIGSGNMTISFGTGTGTAFTNRSDSRIKENIIDADLSMCYEDIKSLPLKRFKYKDFVGNTGDKHLTGFLSSDFAQLLPKAVHKASQYFEVTDENGEVLDGVLIEDCESIDTSQILPTLFGAVQMLMKKVEALEGRDGDK